MFTERAARLLPSLADAIGEALSALERQAASTREVQERRDAVLIYQKSRDAWLKGAISALTRALPPATPFVLTGTAGLGKLELMGDEVVESGILSSRLALRLLDFSSWALNDLRLRIQSLEAVPELRKQDIFRPEVLVQHLVEQ